MQIQNTLVFLLLLAIVWYVRKCSILLMATLRQIECLHEDYDRVTSTHERSHVASEIEMDEHVSSLMSK